MEISTICFNTKVGVKLFDCRLCSMLFSSAVMQFNRYFILSVHWILPCLYNSQRILINISLLYFYNNRF